MFSMCEWHPRRAQYDRFSITVQVTEPGPNMRSRENENVNIRTHSHARAPIQRNLCCANYHRKQRRYIASCLLLRKQFNLWKRFRFLYNAYLVSIHVAHSRNRCVMAICGWKETQTEKNSIFAHTRCVNVERRCDCSVWRAEQPKWQRKM